MDNDLVDQDLNPDLDLGQGDLIEILERVLQKVGLDSPFSIALNDLLSRECHVSKP